MLEWIRTLLVGKRMTQRELQQAIMLEEAMVGQVFELDGAATAQLIKEAGCPVRKFNGTRYDN